MVGENLMTSKRLQRIIFFVLISAFVLLPCVTAAQQGTPTVVIAAKTSMVKVKPSIEAEVVQPVGRGAEFKVTASSEGWLKVSLGDGREGWLPKGEVGLKVSHQGKVCVEMGLSDGLKSGALEGGFRGTGGSTGDSVVLRAKGKLKLEICPELEPGTVLGNVNSAGQNMVVQSLRGIPQGDRIRWVPRLSFEPETEIEYIFEAYCLNFSKHNPEESDRLVPAGTVPEELRGILNVKSSDIDATQLALWAVTDNLSREAARNVFNATDSDVENARLIIVQAGLRPSSYRLFAPQ
jgi:hypothetical protein